MHVFVDIDRKVYLRIAALTFGAALVAGCASTPPAADGLATAKTAEPAESTEEAAVEPDDRPARSRRRHSARLEIQGDYGFTITEEVRISGEVRADYQTALQLLDQRRLGEGIDLLEQVTEQAPDVTAPHINLGIAYGLSGDLERAEASLETALELNPQHPIAHNELGIIYRRTGRFAEARESYENALAVHPSFHFARRNLAVLCDLYLADLRCALENYETYSQAVPEDEEVSIWIADIRNRLGQ
jgi:Flp pilus assembly protein TadD